MDLDIDVDIDVDPAEAFFLGSILLLQSIHVGACVFHAFFLLCSVLMHKQTTKYLGVL